MHDLLPATGSGAILAYQAFAAWCRGRNLDPMAADPRVGDWHISTVACA
jgi:hypothetical protein